MKKLLLLINLILNFIITTVRNYGGLERMTFGPVRGTSSYRLHKEQAQIFVSLHRERVTTTKKSPHVL